MIYRICVQFAHEGSNLRDLRTALLFVLGFYGLFRINELLDVQASDILVHDDHLEINVKSSKTDQFRQGNIVFIAKSGDATCPHYCCLVIFPQLALISVHQLTFSEHFNLIARTIRILKALGGSAILGVEN